MEDGSDGSGKGRADSERGSQLQFVPFFLSVSHPIPCRRVPTALLPLNAIFT
jgi:hypothetical protein